MEGTAANAAIKNAPPYDPTIIYTTSSPGLLEEGAFHSLQFHYRIPQKKKGIRIMTDLCKGLIDMHVHSAPDTRKRAYDDFELMEAAIAIGAGGIVIKSHNGFTGDRAYLCNRHNAIVHGDNDFQMFGSITLNRQVGGINPKAVEVALKLGAKVVWLPTQSAVNHYQKHKKPVPADAVLVVRDGKVVPELEDVFALVRDADAVLGTAHLSPEEIFIVVEAARKAGVKKVVVTHPEWWVVGLTLDEQIRLVKDYDVLLERCYRQPMGGGIYKSNLESNLECIQTVGYQHVMISTDSGQVENVHWELGIQDYLRYMQTHGIPDDQLYYMTHTVQRKLLNLPNP